jgi:hypothetical protein
MMVSALSQASRFAAFFAKNRSFMLWVNASNIRCIGIEIMDHPARYAVQLLSRYLKPTHLRAAHLHF